jgi:signal transduction histidine kinase
VIAHLIGTPLHVIAGRASLIRAAPNDASVAENARRIEEQVERLARRIRALIDYLTAPEPHPTPKSTAAVVAEAMALYGPIAEERGIVTQAPLETLPELPIDGTSGLIILTSLLSLATRVVPRGRRCELRVSTPDPTRVTFELDVPGLEPPRGRIDTLEPPDQPETTGIEELQVLSVCSAIARRNGGNVEVVAGEPGRAVIRFSTARL